MFKLFKLLLKLCTFAVVTAVLLIVVNYIVYSSAKGQVYPKTELSLVPQTDGLALVFPNADKLSETDEEALSAAVALYRENPGQTIYLFGNPKTIFQAEGYLDGQKVPEESILTESDNFSMYESIYALKHVHNLSSVTLLGEDSRTVRGVYIARRMELAASGVKIQTTQLPPLQKLYEAATCVKDFLVVHIHQYQPGKVK